MEQEDTLDQCLLSLSQHHPESRVEVNTDALHLQQVAELQECPPSQMLKQIRTKVPHLLQQTAHVLERDHTGEIFMMHYSQTEHVFLYHF